MHKGCKKMIFQIVFLSLCSLYIVLSITFWFHDRRARKQKINKVIIELFDGIFNLLFLFNGAACFVIMVLALPRFPELGIPIDNIYLVFTPFLFIAFISGAVHRKANKMYAERCKPLGIDVDDYDSDVISRRYPTVYQQFFMAFRCL